MIRVTMLVFSWSMNVIITVATALEHLVREVTIQFQNGRHSKLLLNLYISPLHLYDIQYRCIILLEIPILSGFENPLILDSSYYADAFMVKKCDKNSDNSSGSYV